MTLILILIAVSASVSTVYLLRALHRSRAREVETLHREAETKNFMSIFSQNIRDTDDIGRSMMATARYVADLCEAQAVCIYRADCDELRVLGYCGAYPPMGKLHFSGDVKPKFVLDALRRERILVGSGVIGEVAKRREPLLIEDAVNDPELAAAQAVVPIHTLMAMPLVNDDQLVGVICAINNRRNSRAFSYEQYHRFRFIAKQILIAINITQAYTSLAEQHRISQELSFARKLQASLLPKFPGWKNYDIHMFSRPAKEVSGDFYDFVHIDDNRLLAVVGDVCGKGIPACIVMSMTRTFIRSYIANFVTLNLLLETLNTDLHRDTDGEMYVTLACCLIDYEKGTIEIARAGHTGILINVHSHNRIIYPDGPGLGLMPTEVVEFDTLTLQFLPNTSLLLFTDGITEASNDEEEEFGIKRLSTLFEKTCDDGDFDNFDERLTMAIDSFAGEEEYHQADDQTFVILHHPDTAAGTTETESVA